MTEWEKIAIARVVSAPAFTNRRALEEIEERRIRQIFAEALQYARNRSSDPFWAELAERLSDAIKRLGGE